MFHSYILVAVLASSVICTEIKKVEMPPGINVGIMDSPFWCPMKKSLYFVDLFGTSLFRYCSAENKVYSATIDGVTQPSFLIPTKNIANTFFVGINTTVWLAKWDGKSTKATLCRKLFGVEEDTDHMLNHGIADPVGGFFTGTLARKLCGASPAQGFYHYNKTNGVKYLFGGQSTTNSLGYNYIKDLVYHLDGCRQKLTEYKWDSNSRTLTNGRIILNDFGLPNSAAPVGIAIDTQGILYVSSYKGGIVFKINPRSGKILKKYEMPTKFLSSVAFGGDDMDKLFVLTGKLSADILLGQPEEYTVEEPGGKLLVIEGLGVKGMTVANPIA